MSAPLLSIKRCLTSNLSWPETTSNERFHVLRRHHHPRRKLDLCSDAPDTPRSSLWSFRLFLLSLFRNNFSQEIYSNPTTFDGFRFEKMRIEGGGDAKHKLASLDLHYLVFGHGRQAWCVKDIRFLAMTVPNTYPVPAGSLLLSC